MEFIFVLFRKYWIIFLIICVFIRKVIKKQSDDADASYYPSEDHYCDREPKNCNTKTSNEEIVSLIEKYNEEKEKRKNDN